MTACGREQCQGKVCGNFGERGCKGVDLTRPPWNSERSSRAERSFREQDYRKCADKLCDEVKAYLETVCTVRSSERMNCWNCVECDEPTLKRVCMAVYDFEAERDGKR